MAETFFHVGLASRSLICNHKGFKEQIAAVPVLLVACKVAPTVFEILEMNGTYIKVLTDTILKAEAA